VSAGSRQRKQRIAVVALVAVAAIAMFFGILQVKRHHELVRISYEISDVTEALREAEAENRRLRLERSLLTSPERLEQLAADIGMVQPGAKQIRIIERPEKERPEK
jgi:cell division protein FtsL